MHSYGTIATINNEGDLMTHTRELLRYELRTKANEHLDIPVSDVHGKQVEALALFLATQSINHFKDSIDLQKHDFALYIWEIYSGGLSILLRDNPQEPTNIGTLFYHHLRQLAVAPVTEK